MKLEDQVCGLELAKRLKELGVTQLAEFAWFDCPPLGWGVGNVPSWASENYTAFTVAELGEMLPDSINDGRFWIQCSKSMTNGWRVSYATDSHDFHSEFSRNEADARAKMLIHLIENKLVTPKETTLNE